MAFLRAIVHRRVLVTVLVLIGVILGGISYVNMGLRRFPDIEFPFATISTVMPGGNPEDIETDITKRIEDSISSISGIEEITSYSQQGLSLVLVQFDLEEDIDIKATDISNRLDQISRDLPDAAEDPVVTKFNITDMPIIELALYGPQGVNELYRLADEELEPFLAQASGVANVDLTGGEEREIHVLLDARALRKHHLAIGSVVAALRAANIDVPAGHITQTNREFIVRTTGRFRTVQQVEGVRVSTPMGSVVTVGDLGSVEDTYGEQRTLSRFDGQSAIIMSVLAQSDANEVEVADAVKERLPDLRELLPTEASLEVANDDSVFIRGALGNVRTNIVLGIVLTAIMLFLFLKSGRATLVITVVMPTAIVATFTFMLFSGFSLNILSLTGLAITVGVLVNNAVLIVENVSRFIGEGQSPMEAAVHGTGDISLAIISSTATNLVVFLPLAFMGEIIGRFFRELGLTVVYATVISLAVSFTLTPMMCGLLLRGDGDGRSWPVRLADATVGRVSDVWQWAFRGTRRTYLGVLDWCLAHRGLTVMMTILAVVASVGVF
ncbi:MAG: efflux RND transporter permease subunit, partial [Candidatus Brocadiia bacterium]